MKKKHFLMPTKQKVVATLIILGFVFAATFFLDVLGELMVPADLQKILNEGAFMEMFEENQAELVNLGLRVILLSVLLNLVAVYLAVCIVFAYVKKD
ncbi:hypothetical protein ACFLZH_01620 [Patescibacteria group bacterium]